MRVGERSRSPGSAAALTACEQADLQLKLRHAAVITRHGYVLPIGDEWTARTQTYTPFPPASHDEHEDP